jgi:hypothetical protein
VLGRDRHEGGELPGPFLVGLVRERRFVGSQLGVAELPLTAPVEDEPDGQLLWLKVSQAWNPSDTAVPTGRPVLETTTAANLSGNAATSLSPISPPQSWQNSVTPAKSSAVSQSLIHATCRS